LAGWLTIWCRLGVERANVCRHPRLKRVRRNLSPAIMALHFTMSNNC
jgi:hypothetical protein